MKTTSLLKKVLVTSALSAALISGVNAASKEKKYIIATASTGGTFYPVGVGIATIASLKLAKKNKITFSAITSAGSGENVDMIDKGEVDFAILQGLFGSMAWQGKAKYEGKPRKNLRSVSMLWENVEQFVVYNKVSKTGNIKDMKDLYGKKFSIGKRNSGTRVSGETILSALDIDFSKMDLQFLGYGPSATAMQDGKVDGMNIPSGTPTSAITNAYATIGAKNIRHLEFTDEDIKKIQAAYPVWTRFIIPKETYPGQDKAINTIAQPNLLVVTKDTPDETVYLLTKTMYENLPFLNTVHKATKAMSLKKAISGLPVPLHPGAAKYYKEQGIEIPARLIAK
ncbi:TAXI family TRAP transporter solute-binding subunit [Sulfurospirillum arcachonense]|uniref:TAXI family TRAP transporter solute-binding subunit n=1 Tax=Sulfurospirillum arcachonense TaxID=57666 RepID=UPI0004688585|nr:TAXI family TRAP transporter solute-binding subunit [Sulfurospirillum arcachonense]